MGTVNQQVKLDIFTDTALTEKVAAFDSAHVETALPEHSSGSLVVAGGGGSEAIPLGGITTARIIYIRSNEEVTVTFNGGAEPVTLRPTGEGGDAILLLSGAITAIQIDNAGTDPATVLYALAGE